MPASNDPKPISSAGGRKLVAIVYADMVGYSRLIGLDDAGTLQRLKALRRDLIDPAIEQHSGRIVQTGGDSLLITFDSIDGAVRCAVMIQEQVPVHDGDQPQHRRIRFRMGINIGDVIPDGTDLHGDGVNIAARLEAASPVGGICVSRSVRDHMHGRLSLTFASLGQLNLKNISRPVEAYIVGISETAAASAPPPQVSKPNQPPRLSLVVLPFANLGGDSVGDHVVDGLTDDLITEISTLPGFLVIARSSAFTYKGQRIDIRRVGEELGVRYAVEGSVRATGGGLRINVQLVSTETGAHLWADRFSIGGEGDSYFTDAIIRPIVLALNGRILTSESARSTRDRSDADAIDVLLRARALSVNLAPNPVQWTEVVALYERAVELDPTSVTALTGLASALIDTTDGKAEDPSAAAKYRRASKLIERAELLDPQSAEVMGARVYLLGKQGRYIEVIPLAEGAIEAYPNAPDFNLWLATCLMRSGRAEEAIPRLEQEIRLDPRSPYIYSRYELIAYALTFLGRYDEAISWFQRSLAAHPRMGAWLRSHIVAAIAAAQALSGREEEARVSASEAHRLWPWLTVRSHYRARITGPIAAAQVSRMREGLRLTGLRDHADENFDAGVLPDDVLHSDYDGLTPMTVPGGRTIGTQDLARFIEHRAPLVLDTHPWGESIPRAVGLWGGGIGGSVDDEYQDRIRNKIDHLAGGDLNRPIVSLAWNAERYQSRNLALRLAALGYIEVYWYRGGREAWEVAGLPQTTLIMEEW
jgi:TolB-like protein/class 3 adenylate cyclase